MKDSPYAHLMCADTTDTPMHVRQERTASATTICYFAHCCCWGASCVLPALPVVLQAGPGSAV